MQNKKQQNFRETLRVVLMIMMVFISYANARAVKWTPIQLDQEIQVKAFQDAFYTISPTEDGIMKLITVSGAGTNGYAVTTTGKTVTDGSVETSWSWASDHEPSYLSFAVTAGTTYYISLNFPMDSWSFKATMNSGDFAFISSTPADGATYYITSNETVYLYFTSNSVTFSEGEVTVGDKVIKVYNYKNYNDLVKNGTFTYTEEGTSGIVNWNGAICGRSENENGIAISFTSATGRSYFNVLNKLCEEGSINENDPIKLSIHGIKDNFTGAALNNTGDIELTWYFGGAPTTLIDAKMPSVIKSWFNDGDPDAIATFNFSKEIKSAQAQLMMGQGEGADDLYIEEIATDKIFFNGNSVNVDLSGVLRTNKTMGLKNNWSTFTLNLYRVVDIEGNDTYSQDLGSASSYSYIISYKNISKEVSSEFTPTSGSTLTEETKEIEIWFNNSDVISWDGVNITYKNITQDIFIPKANLTVNEDANETTIIVPIPDELYKESDICVALHITGTIDGMTHAIEAIFNESQEHGGTEVTKKPLVDPAEGRVENIAFIGLQFEKSVSPNPNSFATLEIVEDGTLNATLGKLTQGKVSNILIFTPYEPITKAGNYTFTIDLENVLGENGQSLSGVFEYHYTIGNTDNISQVVFDNGIKAFIYDANGKLIMKSADVQSAKSLKPGLYIINEKKIVIK